MAVTSFNGRVAAITGAGSGMGQWLAILLSRAGCHVAISDVNQATLDEAMKLLDSSVNATSHVVDVSDRSAMEAFAAEVNERHGGVNMIFNNAGVSASGTVEAMTWEDWDWLLSINLGGVVMDFQLETEVVLQDNLSVSAGGWTTKAA